MAKVKAKYNNNQYANEFEFETDIFEKIYAPAHSGHLIFYPDMLVNPWYWSRTVSLVSASHDGTSLPEIFFRGKHSFSLFLLWYILTISRRSSFKLRPVAIGQD